MNQKVGKKKRQQQERDAAQQRGEPSQLPTTQHSDGDNFRKSRGKVGRALKSAGYFFGGIVVTLIFQNLFVSVLPSAGFWIEVRPFPSGEDPCKLHLAMIRNDEEIERFNVKVPIPIVVDSYVIGPSEERVIDEKYQHRIKLDQDSTGKCVISDESRNNYLNLTAAAAGTTLSIQGTDIPRNTFAVAWVVGRTDQKPVALIEGSTDQKTAAGQYSYLRLGQLVTKDIPITFGKWGDPMPWPRARK